MNVHTFKRSRVYIPTALVVLLIIIMLIIFNASFQKNLLLKYAGQEMDSLSVDHIHLTPWSIQIENLQAGYQGSKFSIQQGSIKYCISSLLLFNLNIKEIIFKNIDIDISQFEPPTSEEESPSGIFPGVFALLDHGLGYQLDTIEIDSVVKLPANQSVNLEVTGGGIQPKQVGVIETNAEFYTGVENEIISINNKLLLDQHEGGQFLLLENVLDVDVALQALPQTESVSITFAATLGELTDVLKTSCKEKQVNCFTPEDYSIVIKVDNEAGKNRSLVTVNGNYNGNDGWYRGNYKLTANELLVQPYLGKNKIPLARENLSGEFNLQLNEFIGDITFVSDLQLSDLQEVAHNDKVPQLLELKNSIHLYLLPDNKLRIVEFDADVTDDAEIRPLAAGIPSEMDIPLDDIESFLSQDHTLLEFELPEIPIAWLDFLTPDYEITDGRLRGRFEVSTDQASTIHLKPLEPLVLSNLTVLQGGNILIDQFDISLLPSVAYKNESMDIMLDKFSLQSKQGELGRANAKTTLYLAGEQQGKFNAEAAVNLDVHNVLDYIQGHNYKDTNVPKYIGLNLDTSLHQNPEAEKLVISQLEANIKKDKAHLLKLSLTQPIVLNTAADKNVIASTKGNIAQLEISDIDLNWLSAFIPETELEGRVDHAQISLSMNATREAVITANKPISVKELSIISSGEAKLENIGLEVSPNVAIDDKGINVTYEDLLVTGNARQLVSGKGEVYLSSGDKQEMTTSGDMEIDLQAVSNQPVIANALEASINSPVRFQANYELAANESSINIDTLAANLFYEDSLPRIALTADSKVSVRTKLEENESEMSRARGKLSFNIQNLTPDPFEDILAVKGMSFKDVSGSAVLTSDGETLKLDSIEPFTMTEIHISNEDGAVLYPFDVFMGADMNMQGNQLNIQVKPFGLAFSTQSEVKTIDGQLDAIVTDNNGVTWLNHLDTQLNISLPELLDQPVILPKHKLKTGQLDANISLAPDGQLDAQFKVDNLTANKELPLELIELTVDGQVEKDTSYTFDAPFRTVGKTGDTDLLIKASYRHVEDQNNIVNASLDSSEFYLNDILDFMNAISATIKERKGQPEEGEVEEEVIIENDVTPDQIAFWDVTRYDVNTKLNFEKLYYTEFLIIHNIEGETITSPSELHLKDFQAFFHESPIMVDSKISYTESTSPYDLDIQASIKEFDMKQFFDELMPTSQARSEGLFDVNFVGKGTTPNMSQLRNDLLFDLQFSAEDGLYRLLDPNSALVGGSTNVLGAIGEGVSYIPTGLFGLGAVSRLVDYIKVINFDVMHVHLVRDETQNVTIKDYVIQNPEFLMTATGGIQYQQDKDILNSPMDMTAHLDFRGKGAAIMYDLNLLEDERNEYGYWKGPEINFWGTAANNESNLDEVISTAGNAAVWGGITRPISGLIGNFKHRWFGDKDDPVPYKEYEKESGSSLDD